MPKAEGMELARPLEPVQKHSPLKGARTRRQLSLEEAAARAGLRPEEVGWLEEGRVYRFETTDAAVLACTLYAAALGIELDEAREMAGLPAAPRRRTMNPIARTAAVAAVAALLSGLGVAVVFAQLDPARDAAVPLQREQAPKLPPPWQIQVDVLNGSGDINYTRCVANRITALGYQVVRVTRASRFDYPQTAVYYEPGGARTAVRLARQLGVVVKPLPGGNNPRRHVVIVGPQRGPG